VIYVKVARMKQAVYKDHKVRIDDIDARLRDIQDNQTKNVIKLDSLETHLPKMIREMVDFYLEQQILPKFDNLVQKKEFKDGLSVKMDFVFFKEYLKSQQED
jgi:hypothetical protein